MGVPGDEIFFLISTFFTDSENIYIDYKFNGPFSIEHPGVHLEGHTPKGEGQNLIRCDHKERSKIFQYSILPL
jgi:hypothetical protein